ncbi:MAG: PorT family protein [Tannerellaceae bacterium]|jgi:hypothetical protein|nr:PorT family protein [Tannerellaceae bacterium]
MKTKKIHKWNIIAALLLVGVPQAWSQLSWGVRTGLSHTSMVQQMDLYYRSGWKIGGSVAGLLDIPFYRRFSFRPEVALVYQGGNFVSGVDDDESYAWLNNFKGYSLQPSFNLAYNIPISGVKLIIFLGPAFDFHFKDRLVVEQSDTEASSSDEQALVKAFDFAVNSGISVEFKGAFFQIASLSGIIDRRERTLGNDSPVYQNNITFSLGYFFR